MSDSLSPRLVACGPSEDSVGPQVYADSEVMPGALGPVIADAVSLSPTVLTSSSSELEPVLDRIGDAQIVLFAEALHGARDGLMLRNALFKALVREKGFTAIALESGLTEGRIVQDFIHGGPGELEAVCRGGITWNFDEYRENQDLITWLRDHNADDRRASSLNFYGFDVSGMPGRDQPYWCFRRCLNEVIGILRRAETARARSIVQNLSNLWALEFHTRHAVSGRDYRHLSEHERNTISSAIADVIRWAERHEGAHSILASKEEMQWVIRAAIGLRQLDGWLREFPTNWGDDNKTEPFPLSISEAASNVRDRAQADNLKWIIERERAGKLLVFAARSHLSAEPYTVRLGDGEPRSRVPAGSYLKAQFGEDVVSICHLRGEDAMPANSVEAMLEAMSSSISIMDLRDHRGGHPSCQLLVAGDHEMTLPLVEAFDLLIHTSLEVASGGLAQ